MSKPPLPGGIATNNLRTAQRKKAATKVLPDLLPMAHCLDALRALLGPRRALLKKDAVMAFATSDSGDRFVIDPARADLVCTGWHEDPAVAVLTTHKTLSDLLTGRFDPTAPGPDHIFMWGGDPAVFEAWGAATRGASSVATGLISHVKSKNP